MFVQKVIQLQQTTEEHSPLLKIRYLTGQESSQIFLLWTLQANLSSVNSEEPYVRHYLSKTLRLQFVLKTLYKSTGSASEWFLYTIYLSLVGLFPTVGHTKKAVIPTPGLFIERNYAVSFNNLCRKYRELDLHCINKKNPGYPHFLEKNNNNNNNNNNRRYCFTQSSGLFPQTSSGRMVADKKEQGF